MLLHRLLILALSLSLLIIAAKDAALAHWRQVPALGVPRALRDDPEMRLRLAEAYVAQPQRIAEEAPSIRREARRVLRAAPLHVTAMRQLAIAEGLERPAQGEKLVRLAERITRRDATTQLLLIDQASRTGNVSGTLAHFDRALSVYPALGERLYPVMARALEDSDFRDGLVPLAKRRWFTDFLAAAADRDADALLMNVFLGELRGRLEQVDLQAVRSRFLARLIASQDYAAARELVQQMPGPADGVLGQIGFTAATLDPRMGPMGWNFVGDEAVVAEVEQGVLSVRVAPERAALAAQRVTLLAPGDYVLGGRAVYDASAPRARLEWRISCLGTGRLLLQAGLPDSETQAGHALLMSIPSDCTAQRWELRAYGELAQLASQARLTNLSLTRRGVYQ